MKRSGSEYNARRLRIRAKRSRVALSHPRSPDPFQPLGQDFKKSTKVGEWQKEPKPNALQDAQGREALHRHVAHMFKPNRE